MFKFNSPDTKRAIVLILLCLIPLWIYLISVQSGQTPSYAVKQALFGVVAICTGGLLAMKGKGLLKLLEILHSSNTSDSTKKGLLVLFAILFLAAFVLHFYARTP